MDGASRRLLGILSRSAYASLREVIQRTVERRDVVPGFVASLQTFGAYLNWQPHVHGLVSEGGFTRGGAFVTLWSLDTGAVEQRFRRKVIRQLLRAERLSEEFAERLRSWSPSGFDVHAGRQIGMNEVSRIEEMGRYMTRAAFGQDRAELLDDGRVLVPTPSDPTTGATALLLDPIEAVHRIVMQIPDRGAHGVRYYGAYSCRGRRTGAQDAGTRRSQAEASPSAEAEEALRHAADESPYARNRRRTWAMLLRHIYEVEPL